MLQYHENPETLHVNTLPHARVYDPVPGRAKRNARRAGNLPARHLLSGAWDFA